MELSLRIRDYRKDRGLTIAELADMIGVSTPHLSEVERGLKNVNNHLLIRLSKALDVSPSDLLAEEDRADVAKLFALLRNLSDEDFARVRFFAEGLAATQDAAKD